MHSRILIASLLSLPFFYLMRAGTGKDITALQQARPDAVSYSKEVVLSDNPLRVAAAKLVFSDSFEMPKDKHYILVTAHREKFEGFEGEVLRFWVGSGNHHRLAGILRTGPEGFQKPILFRSVKESFFYVVSNPAATGVFESVFWIAPDRSLQPVEFQSVSETLEVQLRPDEILLSRTLKHTFRADGKIEFSVSIAAKENPCCPVAYLLGTYAMEGAHSFDTSAKVYRSNYMLTTEQLSRKDNIASTDVVDPVTD
jgi:hypothetical protein